MKSKCASHGLRVAALTLLASASASAATLARTSGAFGILTYDPAPARTWEHIDTWCGGGSDNFANTDANWESGEAPDITSNDLLAIFATGGSEALLPAGTAAAFAGIVLDGANLNGDRFEFTAGSGATATIGECALTVSNAPSAITWTICWPITLTDGAQTWNVGENNTVKFDAPIGGDQDLVFAGSGTVELNAGNAHSGSLLFDSGTFTITASGALGSSSRAARYYYDRASLAFHGDLTIDPPIDGTYLSSPNATAGGLKITTGSDVTFNGRVHSSTYMWMTVGPGGMATFENGLGVGANAMLGHLSLDGGGTVVVRNVAADMGGKTIVNGGTTLDVRVAGNQLNAGNAFWTEINDGTLVTRVADALADGSMVYLGSSGVFDLDGHDQSVSAQHGIAGAKVASSRPATLTILGDQDGNAHDSQYGGAGRTNRTAFVGQVNLTKLGSGQQTLAAASTSTGTLKVASGTLSLVGSWVNCTNLVVAGGTFAAKNANAFGDGLRAPGEKPKLEVDVTSGASLALDYDGQIDCSAFRVDGVSLRGTIGAPGSGADHEYAWISGPGLMSAKATGYNDPQGNEITNPDVLDWIEHYQADQADIDALGTNDRFDELFLLNLDLTKSCAAELRISEIRIEDGMAHVGVALSRTEDNVPVGTRKINGTLTLLGRADLATGSFEPLQPDDYDSHFETGNNVGIEYELPASNPPAFFEAVVE